MAAHRPAKPAPNTTMRAMVFSALRASLLAACDHAGRRRKPFQSPDPLLQPPAKFRRPVLEAAVDAEIMGPVMGDIGIELRLPADGDQVGVAVLQDGLGLLGLQDDADRHGGDVGLLPDALG